MTSFFSTCCFSIEMIFLHSIDQFHVHPIAQFYSSNWWHTFWSSWMISYHLNDEFSHNYDSLLHYQRDKFSSWQWIFITNSTFHKFEFSSQYSMSITMKNIFITDVFIWKNLNYITMIFVPMFKFHHNDKKLNSYI